MQIAGLLQAELLAASPNRELSIYLLGSWISCHSYEATEGLNRGRPFYGCLRVEYICTRQDRPISRLVILCFIPFDSDRVFQLRFFWRGMPLDRFLPGWIIAPLPTSIIHPELSGIQDLLETSTKSGTLHFLHPPVARSDSCIIITRFQTWKGSCASHTRVQTEGTGTGQGRWPSLMFSLNQLYYRCLYFSPAASSLGSLALLIDS